MNQACEAPVDVEKCQQLFLSAREKTYAFLRFNKKLWSLFVVAKYCFGLTTFLSRCFKVAQRAENVLQC
jgi:hypothetical protein